MTTQKQYEILLEMQTEGFNVCTCGNCGSVVLFNQEEKSKEDIQCPHCKHHLDYSDFPDFYYEGCSDILEERYNFRLPKDRGDVHFEIYIPETNLKLVEVVADEQQIIAIIDAMNEINKNYSETQIVELFEADGFGFDNIMADLQNNPADFTAVQIVKIQNAFRKDSETNGW